MTERDWSRIRSAVRKRFKREPSPSEAEALRRAVARREEHVRTATAVRKVIATIETCDSLLEFVYARTSQPPSNARRPTVPTRSDLEPTAYLLQVIDGARSFRLRPVFRLAGEIIYWPPSSGRRVPEPATQRYLLAADLDIATRVLGWIHPANPRVEDAVGHRDVPDIAFGDRTVPVPPDMPAPRRGKVTEGADA